MFGSYKYLNMCVPCTIKEDEKKRVSNDQTKR